MIFLSAGPKEPVASWESGINPTILLWGWDWDHQTYDFWGGAWILRLGGFFLGFLSCDSRTLWLQSIVRRPAFGASRRLLIGKRMWNKTITCGWSGCWNMQLHSLKLTANAPENGPKPKNEGNLPFPSIFRCELLVSGRVAIRLSIVIWQFTCLHTQ